MTISGSTLMKIVLSRKLKIEDFISEDEVYDWEGIIRECEKEWEERLTSKNEPLD